MKVIWLVYKSYWDYCNIWETELCAFNLQDDARLFADELQTLWNKLNPEDAIEGNTNFNVKPLYVLSLNDALDDIDNYLKD